jgi:phosphatidate phosphatase APP1
MEASTVMAPSLRQVLSGVDTLVAATQRRARRTFARAESVRISPYRGWATRTHAVVLGRTLLADLAVEAQLERSPRLARVLYERFLTLEATPVDVRVSWRGQQATTTSDAYGFFEQRFELDGKPATETTRADLALASASTGATVQQSAEVFGLQPDAAFAIISDIDDTVLETELSNPYKRGLQLVYSEQRMRLPFEGIAALYQALSRDKNPIFYVSNAPWNLYPHVVELLDHNEIPKGPLLLRDSRLAERFVRDARTGEVFVHKQRALRRLVEEHPGLSFILLGDSSRRDPLRYVEIAEAHPGRVAAIYIRHVHGILARRGSLAELQLRAERAGAEWVLADDTVTLARHAESRGYVPAAEVSRVREGKRQDELTPPVELTSVAASGDAK